MKSNRWIIYWINDRQETFESLSYVRVVIDWSRVCWFVSCLTYFFVFLRRRLVAYMYIYMCVDIYCCLIRTTCRSGAFKSRSRNGKKSACVTRGIIIKIDARLCGLFQFRHEAHTHQQLQLVDTRSMIEIMQSENLGLMRDRKKSREREKEKEKVFFYSPSLFFLD